MTWAAAAAAADGARGLKDCCETGGKPMYPMPNMLPCLRRIMVGSTNWLKLGPQEAAARLVLVPPRPLDKYDCEWGGGCW